MLSCAGCIRGLELTQVYHEESEILFFSCSAINRLAEWKYIWKPWFSAVLRGFFTPIPTHTDRKNAQRYDVPDEETLITILIAKLLGKWLLNGSSALGSVTDQLHVNKDIFICISVPVWKIATVMASPWCTPEDAVWAQTTPQRSSCPDGSSFSSDSNQLHESGHLLIRLIQKTEKLASSAHSLWGELEKVRARPARACLTGTGGMGNAHFPNSLNTSRCDTRDLLLSVQVHLGWRRDMVVGFVSISCSELNLCSCWLEVILDCLLSGIS